jgi:hypothetical protein
VTVSQNCLLAPDCSGGAHASFELDDGGVDAGLVCTSSMIDGCAVRTCTRSGPFTGNPIEESAGDITISGARGGDITFPFVAAQYVSAARNHLWDGGETLTLSATGAAVPAFSGKTVVAPHDVTLVSPAVCPTSHCIVVHRSTPFTVTYAGGESTNVDLSLEWSGAGGFIVADCPFTTSPFTFTPQVLAMFDGADAGEGALVFTPANSTRFSAGDYDVTFTAMGTQFGVLVDFGD